MISVFSYNRQQKEQQIIKVGCYKEVGKRTDHNLQFRIAASPADLQQLDADKLMDIIYFGMDEVSDVTRLKQLRQRETHAMLMLVAAPQLSPMYYLKPDIAPDILLLRPFHQEDFDVVNRELFDAFLSDLELSDEADHFLLQTRDGITRIPYHKIHYFEAVNKKICLRVGDEEYDFYDSLDSISADLPAYFARSHRAYLVNCKKIRRIVFSEGVIEMEGGTTVPLSRTYKPSFKKLPL